MHRANLSAIVRALHAGGPLSRSELVAHTGLTRSAIRSLIRELVGGGLVFEERAARLGTPGRPSPLVRLNPDAAVVMAMEIAVDSVAVALIGLGGTVFECIRTDRHRSDTSVESTVRDLADLAATVCSHRPPDDPLIGVAVAVVGVVRRTDGFVSTAPNLGWRDVPLGERLKRALHLDVPIAVANEADLGALGEHQRGAAVGERDVLFISGEVGVGGGVIVDGKPLTGAAGYAGEVGHIPVNATGSACGCGSVGCWETEIGSHALLRRAGHAAGGGAAELEAVIREAEAGAPSALNALDEGGRWLGFGLAGLVNTFNPRLVVLGGLFGRTLPYVTVALHEQLARLALAAPRALLRVVPATLGVDASLVGAAELAFEPLLDDPTTWLGARDAPRQPARAS